MRFELDERKKKRAADPNFLPLNVFRLRTDQFDERFIAPFNSYAACWFLSASVVQGFNMSAWLAELDSPPQFWPLEYFVSLFLNRLGMQRLVPLSAWSQPDVSAIHHASNRWVGWQ